MRHKNDEPLNSWQHVVVHAPVNLTGAPIPLDPTLLKYRENKPQPQPQQHNNR